MENVLDTIDYKGLTIEIIQDLDPSNPYHVSDLMVPIAVVSFEHGRSYRTQYGIRTDYVDSVPVLTRDQIKANLKAIIQLVEVKSVWALTRDRYEYASAESCINDAIAEYIGDLSNSDRLEALETVYGFAGIPCLLESRNGFSQGDYIEVLAVAFPEFQKACGNDPEYWKNTDNLKGSIDEFAAWSFGDCYGFNIRETGDSCFGFYGSDHEKSGLLGMAKESIDSYLETQQENAERSATAWALHCQLA